ncbi:MAG TPA: hypothetical protein VG735_03325, partial [Caulobacterales bacterium]|nr:hypothetical protein [Caulobacterales bacterium]
ALAISKAGRRRKSGGQQQGGDAMGAIFGIFPLILIPVLIYNIIAFGGSALKNAQSVREWMLKDALNVPMASSETIPNASGISSVEHVQWLMTRGDMLVLLALVLLFIELLKSTSTGTSAIFNHALSMLVFIACLVEFLLHPAFATSTFFLIMIMSLLDVLAGVIVTIVSARRDVEFDKN